MFACVCLTHTYNQIILLYTQNQYNSIDQLYFNKANKNINKPLKMSNISEINLRNNF